MLREPSWFLKVVQKNPNTLSTAELLGGSVVQKLTSKLSSPRALLILEFVIVVAALSVTFS